MQEAEKRAYYEQQQGLSALSMGLPGYAVPTPMAGTAPVTVEQEIGRLAEEVAQVARSLAEARRDSMQANTQLADVEKRFADLSARLSQAMAQHSSSGQVNVLR